MHVDRRLLGWGLFFILVGAIPLAVRANLVSASLVSEWPNLWPLLLIGWGIGLLLRSTPIDWIGGAITAIVFGVMGGGLLATGAGNLSFATGCSGNPPMSAFESRSGDLAAAAHVNVSFNCGSLHVGTTDGSTWRLTGSDRDARGPKVTSSATEVSIEPDSAIGFPGGIRSDWTVTLPRTPKIDLGLTLNAGQGTIDLAGATVGASSITLNAGKLDLSMGAVAGAGDLSGTVNAGEAAIALDGTARNVDLSLNAGSLQLCMPASSALRVSWSGTLGSNNFSGAGLTKVDASTWTSASYNPLEPHTELHVSANAGSFELRLGGTCRA